MKLTEGDVYWFVFEYEVANRPTAGRLVRGLVSRQFLHRAADWLRSLDVIQLADILVCAYWCLLVRERSVLADPYCHSAWNSVCLLVLGMLTGPQFPGSRKFFPFPGKNFPNGNFQEIGVYCIHGTVTQSTVW